MNDHVIEVSLGPLCSHQQRVARNNTRYCTRMFFRSFVRPQKQVEGSKVEVVQTCAYYLSDKLPPRISAQLLSGRLDEGGIVLRQALSIWMHPYRSVSQRTSSAFASTQKPVSKAFVSGYLKSDLETTYVRCVAINR